MKESFLNGKRILAVDDEPDVLAVLGEEIREGAPNCIFEKVMTYNEGVEKMVSWTYDLVILDIMGVRGFDLLSLAVTRNFPVAMLTAHALTPEDTIKSFKEGAAYFVPKEKMGEIATYLKDVLEAKEKGKNLWSRWMSRFAAHYDEKFGKKWRVQDKDFWERLGWD